VSDQPSQSTVDILTEIWQRVLKQASIHPDDNFFHLGGNDSLADKLFAEITRVLGRELPSATIFRAPTISKLSALLAESTLPRFSPFVPLKAGDRNPPILITHGVGGRASFSQLANHIRTAHPVYGIQAKGVDGMGEPYERIEDMASFYLDELNRLQTQGPYMLIGYSFGGLVAVEMAQRLSNDGKKVALLVLVDTYPHPKYFPLPQRLWLAGKRATGHLAEMKKMPIRTAFAYLARGLKHRLRSAADHGATKPSPLSLAQTTARVKECDFRAMASYRPRFYKGKIRFVRPESNSYLPNNPTALWKPLASELEVETVPGDHLGMVGEHFESLAAVLTRYVQESVDGNK
jgi:aspartate racemase